MTCPGMFGSFFPTAKSLAPSAYRQNQQSLADSGYCLVASVCCVYREAKEPSKKRLHLRGGVQRAFIRLKSIGRPGRPDLAKLG